MSGVKVLKFVGPLEACERLFCILVNESSVT